MLKLLSPGALLLALQMGSMEATPPLKNTFFCCVPFWRLKIKSLHKCFSLAFVVQIKMQVRFWPKCQCFCTQKTQNFPAVFTMNLTATSATSYFGFDRHVSVAHEYHQLFLSFLPFLNSIFYLTCHFASWFNLANWIFLASEHSCFPNLPKWISTHFYTADILTWHDLLTQS